MMPRLQGLNLALAIRLAGAGVRTAVEASAQGIYRQAPLFSTAPSETAPLPTITCFRPAAIGIDPVQAAFTMLIRNVEDGSPAATVGRESAAARAKAEANLLTTNGRSKTRTK